MSMPNIRVVVDGQESVLTGDRILSTAVAVPKEVQRFEGQVVVFLNHLLSVFDWTGDVRCSSPRGESVQVSSKELGRYSLLSTNTPSWKLVPAGRDQLAEITTPRFVLREVSVIELGVEAGEDLLSDQVYTNLTDALMRPEAVRFLNLTSAHIEVFPPGIFELVNLESLNLGRNRIEVIPPEIGELRKLKVLKLSRNRLRTLPEEMGRLKELTELHCSRNEIEILPEKLWNLDRLELLNLGKNRLRRIPDGIASLNCLKELELSDNPLPAEERERIRSLIPDVEIEW